MFQQVFLKCSRKQEKQENNEEKNAKEKVRTKFCHLIETLIYKISFSQIISDDIILMSKGMFFITGTGSFF